MPSQKRSRKGQLRTELLGSMPGNLVSYGSSSNMEICIPQFPGALINADADGSPNFMPGTPFGNHLKRPLPLSSPSPSTRSHASLPFPSLPLPLPLPSSTQPEESDEADDFDDDNDPEGIHTYPSKGSKQDLKRPRLTVDQVQSLERSFKEENRLEPERKRFLARQLDLKPRQVAVWFQNRRVRYKTKQMERDYDGLKASMDSLIVDHDLVRGDYALLKADYEDLLHENAQLCAQLTHLNSRLMATEEASKSQFSKSKDTNSPKIDRPAVKIEHLSEEDEPCPSSQTSGNGKDKESVKLNGSRSANPCEPSSQTATETVTEAGTVTERVDSGENKTEGNTLPTSSGSDVTESDCSMKGSDASSAPTMMLTMRGGLNMDLDNHTVPLSPLPPLMELPDTPTSEESQLWGSIASSNLSMYDDEICDNMQAFGDLACTSWWDKGEA